MDKWQVYFDDNYMIDKSKLRPGREVTVRKTFLWNDNECQIPAVYLFEEGIVVDFCMRVDNLKVQAFFDKWHLNEVDDITHLSRENRMQIKQEHPLSIQADYEICCNGEVVLRNRHGSGSGWNACSNKAYDDEILGVMEHYHLDKKESWGFWREAFELEPRQMDNLKTVEITLKSQKKQRVIGCFRLNEIGEQYQFINPLTGIEHVIEAVSFEQKILSKHQFPDNDIVYPKKYMIMEYNITPPMDQNSYYIQDTSEGDAAHKREICPDEKKNGEGSVIGFSTGAVSVITGISNQKKSDQSCCVAYSAVHYDFVDEVKWRIVVIDENVKKMAVEMEWK